jgi:hypothetical protein
MGKYIDLIVIVGLIISLVIAVGEASSEAYSN